MQQPPASLTACNEQLVEALQDLRSRRAEVNRDVLLAEKEKLRVEREIAALNARLEALTTELAGKLEQRAEYDRTIRETEVAYAKIVESSETLLRVLKREATHLQQQQQQKGATSTVLGSGLGAGAAAVTGAGHARRGVE